MIESYEKEGNFFCSGCGKMKDYDDDECDCDSLCHDCAFKDDCKIKDDFFMEEFRAPPKDGVCSFKKQKEESVTLMEAKNESRRF